MLNDWDTEYAERAAVWWELFVDLLIVAACSNLAEALHERTSWFNLFYCFLLFGLFYSGWEGYAFFNSRFFDGSLVHSMTLFVYMLGTSGMVANASSFLHVHQFASWAAVQQLSLGIMLFSVYVFAESPRAMVKYELTPNAISTSLLVITSLCPSNISYGLLFATLVWNVTSFLLMALFLDQQKLIPINIEHNSERQGCLVMVVSGESIVSAVIYRDSKEKPEHPMGTIYFVAMALFLLLTFSFGMLYYAIVPPRSLHALRRSRLHSVAYIWIHVPLNCALLCIGVVAQAFMGNILEDKDSLLPRQQVILLFASVAIALLCMLCIRCLHFFGRQPAPSDPPHIRMVKWVWWALFLIICFIPATLAIIAALSWPAGLNSFVALTGAVLCVFTFVLVASTITHYITDQGYGDFGAERLLQHSESVSDD